MPDLNFGPAFDFLKKYSEGDEETIGKYEKTLVKVKEQFEEEIDRILGGFAKKQIEKVMQDMLMKNHKCDYTFVLNDQEYYKKNIKALDAYMIAYHASKYGDILCYMSPSGRRAFKPVFTVIDGKMTLNGQEIGQTHYD